MPAEKEDAIEMVLAPAAGQNALGEERGEHVGHFIPARQLHPKISQMVVMVGRHGSGNG